MRCAVRLAAVSWISCCRESGIELLVASGSATAGVGSARDLDLAVELTPCRSLLSLHDVLARYLHVEYIDLLDLGRAGEVAGSRH